MLFEVEAPITGPWRAGVLLSDDGLRWNEPQLYPADLVAMPQSEATKVRFVIKDYDRAWLPSVPRATGVDPEGIDWNSDTGMVRASGIEERSSYRIDFADLPSAAQLESGKPTDVPDDTNHPAIPDSVKGLLQSGDAGGPPWLKFDSARKVFLDSVVADGQGVPVEMSVERFEELLAGGKGSPFEITASIALLARWVGFPSRIAFGYDGGARVGESLHVHERDAAFFLEFALADHGWLPLLDAPKQSTCN